MSWIIRTALILFTFLAILWSAGLIAFNTHVKGIPALASDIHTEAIVVLTGGPNRINTGLDLLEEKKADYLFISGVNTRVSVDQLISMWKKDIRRKPCCIILGHEARNTFENAVEARDWIEMNDIGSMRLLTTDYHMPRALLEFKTMLPDMEIYLHALVPDQRNWTLIVHEYNKTLFTLFRLALTR